MGRGGEIKPKILRSGGGIEGRTKSATTKVAFGGKEGQ